MVILLNEEMNELYNHPKVKCMINTTKGEGFGRPLLRISSSLVNRLLQLIGVVILILLTQIIMCIIGTSELKPVHPSAANQFLLKESQWFNINTAIAR